MAVQSIGWWHSMVKVGFVVEGDSDEFLPRSKLFRHGFVLIRGRPTGKSLVAFLRGVRQWSLLVSKQLLVGCRLLGP